MPQSVEIDQGQPHVARRRGSRCRGRGARQCAAQGRSDRGRSPCERGWPDARLPPSRRARRPGFASRPRTPAGRAAACHRGDRLVERLAADQVGDHQEALETPPGAHPFAGRDHLGHGDPQRPHALQVPPFGRAGRVASPAGSIRAASARPPGGAGNGVSDRPTGAWSPNGRRPALLLIGPAWRGTGRGSRGSCITRCSRSPPAECVRNRSSIQVQPLPAPGGRQNKPAARSGLDQHKRCQGDFSARWIKRRRPSHELGRWYRYTRTPMPSPS